MARATMSKDGSVVIPKSVRDAHGLKDGTVFEVIDGEKTIVLTPVVMDVPARLSPGTMTMAEFLASLPTYQGPPVDVSADAMRQAIDEAAIEDWQRLERQWHEDKNG
jgi:AbrB family looped-hinge helix DNA binding protein